MNHLHSHRAAGWTGGLGMLSLYICVCVGWDKSHIHNDEEGSSVNVTHLNRGLWLGSLSMTFPAVPSKCGICPAFNCLSCIFYRFLFHWVVYLAGKPFWSTILFKFLWYFGCVGKPTSSKVMYTLPHLEFGGWMDAIFLFAEMCFGVGALHLFPFLWFVVFEEFS